MLEPFGCGEVKIFHGEEKDQSAGRLVVPKSPGGARDEEQGPSITGKDPKRDDGQEGRRQSEEPMQQDPDQAEKRTTRLRQEGCPAWNSTSSATLKTTRTRWKRRMIRQMREIPRWSPRRPSWKRTGIN